MGKLRMSTKNDVQIKTGQEVVDDFVVGLKQDKTLDADIINLISDLHEKSSLTTTSLSNSLKQIREKKFNEQDKN